MMAIFDATVFGLCVCVLSVWRVTVICGVWVLWVVSGLGERVSGEKSLGHGEEREREWTCEERARDWTTKESRRGSRTEHHV